MIAIIGILAAILFPVFSRAREGARRASCASNLKQIVLALTLYAQDNQRWPRSWFGSTEGAVSDATDHYKWMDALQNYVRNEATFNCPSDSTTAKYKFRDGINYGSYGMNCSYYALNDGRTAPYGIRPGRVRDPSSTVQILDSSSPDGGGWAVEWETEPPPVKAGPPRRLATAVERHNGTLNGLYCDGHVKAQSLDQLMQKNAAGTLVLFTNEAD